MLWWIQSYIRAVRKEKEKGFVKINNNLQTNGFGCNFTLCLWNLQLKPINPGYIIIFWANLLKSLQKEICNQSCSQKKLTKGSQKKQTTKI